MEKKKSIVRKICITASMHDINEIKRFEAIDHIFKISKMKGCLFDNKKSTYGKVDLITIKMKDIYKIVPSAGGLIKLGCAFCKVGIDSCHLFDKSYDIHKLKFWGKKEEPDDE